MRPSESSTFDRTPDGRGTRAEEDALSLVTHADDSMMTDDRQTKGVRYVAGQLAHIAPVGAMAEAERNWGSSGSYESETAVRMFV